MTHRFFRGTKKFNRWSSTGKLIKISKSLVKDPDYEWTFLDGSFVKAHQHGHGAVGNKDQAIGKSKGGNTTKIHMVVDSFGLPIDFDISGGNVHDVKAAPELVAKLPPSKYTIAERGYDSQLLRE